MSKVMARLFEELVSTLKDNPSIKGQLAEYPLTLVKFAWKPAAQTAIEWSDVWLPMIGPGTGAQLETGLRGGQYQSRQKSL
jgi:hypothetical protein